MTQNQENTGQQGQGYQQDKGGEQYRGQKPGDPSQLTGPSTGGARGNDMPSERGTQKDSRAAEGTQTVNHPGGQQTPGRSDEDNRDTNESQAERQGQAGREAEGKRGQDTSKGSGQPL